MACIVYARLTFPLQIDFYAVGAATGLKAPAARMRFTRLKKTIDANSLVSTPSVRTGGKTGNAVQGGSKINTKKRKVQKQMNAADQNATAGSKIKTQSPDHEAVAPSAPIKCQARGKKIDISAAFESDASPTPGPRIQPGDDTSDYEKEDDEFHSGPDSESRHEAKRRRGSPHEREMSQQDVQRKLFLNKRIPSVPDGDLRDPAQPRLQRYLVPKLPFLELVSLLHSLCIMPTTTIRLPDPPQPPTALS